MYGKKRKISAISKKRGSAAVLLTVIFISLVSAFSIITEIASEHAAENTADAALSNAGRIILSCYDKELQERYGIFGVEMDEAEIEENAEKIIEETFDAAPLKRSSTEAVHAEGSGYSLAEPENLKTQILALMKYKSVDDLMEFITESIGNIELGMENKDDVQKNIEDDEASMALAQRLQEESESEAESGSAGDSDEAESIDFDSIKDVHRMFKDMGEEARSSEPEQSEENSVLRNGRIWDSLPSVTHGAAERSAFDGSGVFDYVSTGTAGIASLYESFIISQYITDYFTNHTSEEKTGFFQNEVEYVLYGNKSDRANYMRAYASVFAIREAMNIVYIFTDTEKKAEALALAAAVVPGPWVTLTQYIILTAWSAVESWNDMKNLTEGNGVPVMKTKSTWMVSFDSIAEGGFSGGYIEIDGDSMMTYDNYLKILLMTEEEEVKLYRIMDLIQINMKGSVREEFLIADHLTGFTLTADIKKKSFSPYVRSRTFSMIQSHSYIGSEE